MSSFANVYVGAAPNDLTGDPLRNAFQKINTNFANIASGNANVVINAPVHTVAGRTGNVYLTVNDVLGAASNAWVNAQTTAANAYANVLYATTTSNITNNVYAQVSANLSSNIAQTASDLISSGNLLVPVYANINATNANVSAANASIAGLSSTVGGINTTVGLLVTANTAQDANLGTATTNIITLTANAGLQAQLIGSLRANITAANIKIAIHDANLGTATTNIVALQANAATQDTYITVLTANAAIQGNILNGLVANATTQATAINNINANLGTATTNISNLQTNAAVQHDELIALITNSATQGSQINSLSANLGTATINITALQADVAVLESNLAPVGNLVANDAIQAGQISTLDANLGTATTNIGLNLTAINALRANVTAANAAIITANTGMKSYVDTVTTAWTANAVTQAVQIDTINANLGTATTNITTLLSNAGSQSTDINALRANITAANLEINSLRANVTAANAVTSTYISTTNANVTAINVSVASTNANVVSANVEINNLRANITAANTRIAPVANLNAITGNLIPAVSNVYTIGTTTKYWSELHVGGNIESPSYLLAGKSVQTPLTETANITANTALIYIEAIVGNIRTVDEGGTANLANIITTSGVFWANGAEYNYSNVRVTEYLAHFDGNMIPGGDNIYNIGEANFQVRDIYLSNALVINGQTLTVSGQQISIDGLPLTANTGNIAFSGTTITTDAGAGTGIILNSAGAGEIAMQDYVGINNTNPGYWLHIGDGAPGAVNNTGNISIDYNNGLDTRRGSTIMGYAWWDASSNGNDNRGTGVHTHFGIYKNDDTFDNKFLEFDYTSGNANVGNLTATSLTVLTNVSYTMANYQNWTSNVSTIGAALDQLAQRLKDAGY